MTFLNLYDQWPTQISIVIRTEILDKATKTFIDLYPEAAIINIGNRIVHLKFQN